MKTIGLIGGMSWESSLEYYRLINLGVKERLGGLHSAQTLMYSVDFAEIERLQHHGEWEHAAQHLAAAAQRLEQGGADFIVLCTNTMHKVAAEIQASTRLPLLHIADPTAQAIRAQGIKRVGLLGTRFTMEEAFYKERLQQPHGLEVIIPDAEARTTVHRIIYDELCLGEIRPASKVAYQAILQQLTQAGAEGVILGCTEITLLIQQAECAVSVFDTTRLHATAAVEMALRAG